MSRRVDLRCNAPLPAPPSSQVDLNISLTAIGLMWNMADFFGRTINALLLMARGATAEGGAEGGVEGEGEGEEKPQGALVDPGAQEKAAMVSECLLIPLFTALQVKKEARRVRRPRGNGDSSSAVRRIGALFGLEGRAVVVAPRTTRVSNAPAWASPWHGHPSVRAREHENRCR